MATVLVVDDLPLVRMLACRYLEPNGHRVIQAANGREAIEAYKRHKPNAVLMDLVMPELDGMAALREIKTFDPKARVAMFTADSEVDKVKGALSLGAIDYVVKPFRPERLNEALTRLLEG
jgi:two-component system chemotaxis response regulator CheY